MPGPWDRVTFKHVAARALFRLFPGGPEDQCLKSVRQGSKALNQTFSVCNLRSGDNVQMLK